VSDGVNPPAASADPGPGAVSRRLVATLAIATGVAVASLYYAQPLLDLIAVGFGVSVGTAGLLVAITQLGYLVGIVLLVPLGDLLERRRLITACFALAAVAAAACAVAPTIAVLAAALAGLGALAAVAQILVPLASSLAAPQERGQVVGTVMSGLLIGILGARVVSGLVAELVGWRGVYALAALLLAALAVLLTRSLPPAPPPLVDTSYRATLGSVVVLVREEPVLRQRMGITVLNFASFAILWTSLTFLLSAQPFDYSEAVIGLFGIAGIAGAAVAPLSGRLADRGHARLALTVFLLLAATSWGLLALGRSHLLALIVGIVIFDMAAQGAHINNQAAVYALRPEARSRLTTALICASFVGMVIGSTLASIAYEAGGWMEVCAIGAGLSAAAAVIWAATQRIRHQPTAEPGSAPG
jgi:predicted MFS family arabinose efflux permease